MNVFIIPLVPIITFINKVDHSFFIDAFDDDEELVECYVTWYFNDLLTDIGALQTLIVTLDDHQPGVLDYILSHDAHYIEEMVVDFNLRRYMLDARFKDLRLLIAGKPYTIQTMYRENKVIIRC